jgi:hypothetical protein
MSTEAPTSALSAVIGGHPIRGVPNAKFFRFVQEQLEPLKNMPAHGNRKLHFHPIVVTLVVSFYDPLIRSLRGIEGESVVEPLTGAAVQRMARSTTSDALRTFDPQLLRPIINNLHRQVPQLRKTDPNLQGVLKEIVAADGTYLSVFSDTVWALIHTKSNGQKQGQVRLNCQISVTDWVPRVITVSGDEACDGSEPDAVARDLLSGVLYVIDRNFIDFDFLPAVRAKGSDFVLRIRSNAPAYEIIESRALSPQDIAQGVTGDHLVRLTGRDAPEGNFRLVQVRHASKAGETVSLLTNLTDPAIAAHVIGYIYKQRWQIELFFRWLKLWCNFDHLLSTSRNGITMQFYCIMIATLLMHIHLGRKVSKYTLIAMHLIANKGASFEQMQEFLARRDRERELAQIRRAKKAAAKKV